jgi:hypothetical protein
MKPLSRINHVDEKKHLIEIERLAASAQVRVEDVRPLYQKVLAEMLNEARITTYLHIFTARKVGNLLVRVREINLGIRNGKWPGISTA